MTTPTCKACRAAEPTYYIAHRAAWHGLGNRFHVYLAGEHATATHCKECAYRVERERNARDIDRYAATATTDSQLDYLGRVRAAFVR